MVTMTLTLVKKEILRPQVSILTHLSLICIVLISSSYFPPSKSLEFHSSIKLQTGMMMRFANPRVRTSECGVRTDGGPGAKLPENFLGPRPLSSRSSCNAIVFSISFEM